MNTVEQAVQRLADVEGPLNAAAYEMEVNVNGIGLAVLKYLDSSSSQYRAWVAEDSADFAKYYKTYMDLIRSPRERE